MKPGIGQIAHRAAADSQSEAEAQVEDFGYNPQAVEKGY
jgi:hypothetical protein